MLEITNPTEKLKEICSELGSEYSIKVVNAEQVIYRKINDNYYLEVSGLNNNHQTMNATIYIWHLKSNLHFVESKPNITNLESLTLFLDILVGKYQNLN